MTPTNGIGIATDWSPYHYAKNNPVMFNDPMGDAERPTPDQRSPVSEQYVDWNPGYRGFGYTGSSPGSWIDGIHSLGNGIMGANDFINSAFRSSSGGTWSRGTSYFFRNQIEAFEIGEAMVKEAGGWAHTEIAKKRAEKISKYMFRWRTRRDGTRVPKYIGLNAQAGQQGFDQILKSFRDKYFGSAIADIEAMYNGDSGSNWKIDWKVAALPKGTEGATGHDYGTGTITIAINLTAFKDPRFLALVVGHELVHARDIANGNRLAWGVALDNFDESPWSPLWVVMETHAWQWTLQAEQNPRINMKLGDGAEAWLNTLIPKIPTGFSFAGSNR